MNTLPILTEVFADNFVFYFRAHSCHLNVTGRNFAEDHEMLGDIYEDAQAQIDVLGELIRTLQGSAPETVAEILFLANLKEETTGSDADSMLALVLEGVEHMVSMYQELGRVADEAGDIQIANFAQDRILVHTKQAWQLRSTLE